MHCISLGRFSSRGVKGRGATVFHPSTSHFWSFLYTFPSSPTISTASVPHTFPLSIRSSLLQTNPPFSFLSSLPLCLFISPSFSFNPRTLFSLSRPFYLSPFAAPSPRSSLPPNLLLSLPLHHRFLPSSPSPSRPCPLASTSRPLKRSPVFTKYESTPSRTGLVAELALGEVESEGG